MKTTIKHYGTIALFMVFSLFATSVQASNETSQPPTAALKYIGILKDRPVFQLDVSSVNDENLAISIRDQFGEVLYSERVTAKVYSKKFLLDLTTLGDAVLRVEVKSGKNKPEVFTINRNTRYYEETSITKF